MVSPFIVIMARTITSNPRSADALRRQRVRRAHAARHQAPQHVELAFGPRMQLQPTAK